MDGEDAALTGTLRMNEPGIGIAVYAVHGSFEAPTLTLTGQPEAQIEGVEFGQLNVIGAMNKYGIVPGRRQKEIINRARDRLIRQCLLARTNGELRLTGKVNVHAVHMKPVTIK